MLLFIFMLLVGATLGQRFPVLVLVPASLITLVGSVGLGIARAQTPWTIVLVAVAAVVCLQIGYLLGLGIRQFVEARARPQQSAPFAESSSAQRRTAH
jgi:hypothetical protein